MLTPDTFREFVQGGTFTAVFTKKDGTLRTMNARLGVAKWVKGTAPDITAKRNATLQAQNMVGVYEMRGTSDRVEAENYRTLNLATLLELRANGAVMKFEGAK